jgi:hypothetical protein
LTSHLRAVAGAASGSFASAGPPTLAPIESSEAFLVAYQDIRGRLFTAVEQEIAWAASLWPAAHNARWEALHGDTRCAAMRSGHKQPNAFAGLMPNMSMRDRVLCGGRERAGQPKAEFHMSCSV